MALLQSTDDRASEHNATLHALLGILSVCAELSQFVERASDAASPVDRTQRAVEAAQTVDLVLGVVRLVATIQANVANAQPPEIESHEHGFEPSATPTLLREISR